MKPKEIVAHWREMGPQDMNVLFRYLADHFRELRLESGLAFWTPDGMRRFLEELAAASREPAHLASLPLEPLPDTCPRCGHIHEGEAECSFEFKPGSFCRCEVEVPA